MADIDAALVQQVFDVSKREWKSDVHQHAQLDDLGRGFEVPERVLGHFLRLNTRIGHLKTVSADNTLARMGARLASSKVRKILDTTAAFCPRVQLEKTSLREFQLLQTGNWQTEDPSGS